MALHTIGPLSPPETLPLGPNLSAKQQALARIRLNLASVAGVPTPVAILPSNGASDVQLSLKSPSPAVDAATLLPAAFPATMAASASAAPVEASINVPSSPLDANRARRLEVRARVEAACQMANHIRSSFTPVTPGVLSTASGRTPATASALGSPSFPSAFTSSFRYSAGVTSGTGGMSGGGNVGGFSGMSSGSAGGDQGNILRMLLNRQDGVKSATTAPASSLGVKRDRGNSPAGVQGVSATVPVPKVRRVAKALDEGDLQVAAEIRRKDAELVLFNEEDNAENTALILEIDHEVRAKTIAIPYPWPSKKLIDLAQTIGLLNSVDRRAFVFEFTERINLCGATRPSLLDGVTDRARVMLQRRHNTQGTVVDVEIPFPPSSCTSADVSLFPQDLLVDVMTWTSVRGIVSHVKSAVPMSGRGGRSGNAKGGRGGDVGGVVLVQSIQKVRRGSDGGREFLVKWVGSGMLTWEAESSLVAGPNGKAVIDEFVSRERRKKVRSQRGDGTRSAGGTGSPPLSSFTNGQMSILRSGLQTGSAVAGLMSSSAVYRQDHVSQETRQRALATAGLAAEPGEDIGLEDSDD